ncbi:unnamed protein product [Prunus armeniaca]
MTFVALWHTSNETLAHVQLDSTQFSPPNPSNQADLNLRVKQLTYKVDDQNQLVGQLLSQINLVCDLGPGSHDEKRMMDEHTDKQVEKMQASKDKDKNVLPSTLACHKHPQAPSKVERVSF